MGAEQMLRMLLEWKVKKSGRRQPLGYGNYGLPQPKINNKTDLL